nr:hypothetical protein [Pandoravirus aubagnensis]
MLYLFPPHLSQAFFLCARVLSPIGFFSLSNNTAHPVPRPLDSSILFFFVKEFLFFSCCGLCGLVRDRARIGDLQKKERHERSPLFFFMGAGIGPCRWVCLRCVTAPLGLFLPIQRIFFVFLRSRLCVIGREHMARLVKEGKKKRDRAVAIDASRTQ